MDSLGDENQNEKYDQIEEVGASEECQGNTRKENAMKFMSSSTVQTITVTVIISSLFLDDLRLAVTALETDVTFHIIFLVFLILFSLEFGIYVWAMPGYYRGFYFYLDIVATLSLIPDIGFIWEPLIGDGHAEGDSTQDQEAAMRTGRVSRVGTRAGRIVRLIRIIRVVRVVKLLRCLIATPESTVAREFRRGSRALKVAPGPGNICTRHPSGSVMLSPSSKRVTRKSSAELVKIIKPNPTVLEQKNGKTPSGRTNRATSLFRRASLGPSKVRKRSLFTFQTHRDEELEQSTEQELHENPCEVGKRMTEKITQQVVILVLVMLIFFPIFDFLAASEHSDLKDTGLQAIHRLSSTELSNKAFIWQVEHYRAATDGELLGLEIRTAEFPNAGVNIVGNRSQEQKYSVSHLNRWLSPKLLIKPEAYILKHYRTLEYHIAQAIGCFDDDGDEILGSQASDCSSTAYFSIKEKSQSQAWVAMAKTLFVLILLSGGVMGFTRNAETIMIFPIEQMIRTVKILQTSPIGLLAMADTEFAELTAVNELDMLDGVLKKSANLLMLGFGEAGVNIIKQNLTSEGKLDPLVPGRKVFAAFGFCDIRKFTDTTECLQEDVMLFVNRIAFIVHDLSLKHGGAPNKVVGDCFFICWKLVTKEEKHKERSILQSRRKRSNGYRVNVVTRSTSAGYSFGRHKTDNISSRVGILKRGESLPPKALQPSQNGHAFALRNGPGSNRELKQVDELAAGVIATNSLAAFVTILIQMNQANEDEDLSTGLAQYRRLNSIKRRFGPGRFRVAMGFGLHFGWAIEGGIGSPYRVEASYLSPHVNIAARLESASKQYSVPILFSSELFKLLSPAAKRKCRQIDKVIVKGSAEPSGIYTIDVTNLNINLQENRDDSVRYSMARKLHMANFDQGFLSAIQSEDHDQFLKEFQEAFDAYEGGNWSKAKDKLELLVSKPRHCDDGPAHTLLLVMKQSNFVAPKGWQGYRFLEMK